MDSLFTQIMLHYFGLALDGLDSDNTAEIRSACESVEREIDRLKQRVATLEGQLNKINPLPPVPSTTSGA